MIRQIIPATLVCAFLPLGPLFAGCSRSPRAEPPVAPQARSPREKGEARARVDLARGKRRILRYGNPLSPGSPARDVGSGLPVRSLIDCCVTAEAREETEAYNRVMRESVPPRPPAR